jgi:hypothetical protein
LLGRRNLLFRRCNLERHASAVDCGYALQRRVVQLDRILMVSTVWA